jgi:hypothetical protein
MDAILGFFGDGKGIALGVEIALIVTPFLLPNALVQKFAYGVGALFSTFLRQKVGRTNEERIEAYFSGTIDSFVTGLKEGMASDSGNGGG